MDRHLRDEAGMRVASIDLGTNTLLLLIADIDERGIIHPVAHEQRLPRLGRDVDKNKMINAGAFDRIGWILTEYKNLALQEQAEVIIAGATSAVRDAANREEFLAYLKRTTGVDVAVISGDEEAVLTYRGALSGFENRTQPGAVIDIGGGSTEISSPTSGKGTHSLHRRSFQIGSVRLTERCFSHQPPAQGELDQAREIVASELSHLPPHFLAGMELIGVAGSVTTLACLEQHLVEFDVEQVSGYVLPFERVSYWLEQLSSMSTDQILALSTTTAGRADILTAGALILHETMRYFQMDAVRVSERGLRYGLALKAWEDSK